MSAPLTVAAVQCAPLFDDVAATSRHILDCAKEAASGGARLLLFPESYLQGHSYTARTIAHRALPLDAPAIIALAEALAAFRLTTIVGFFERRLGAVHNSAMVIEAGRIVGRYAKQDPREGGCTPGTERPVFACCDWPFAISICRDTRSADQALDFARRGARLLCYPLNNMLPPEMADPVRELTLGCHAARARETGCWVLSADVTGTAEGWKNHGSTRLYDPSGSIAAEVPEGETGMILATIG